MLRSFVVPLVVVIAVVFADCTVPINWGVQPQPTGPTAPPLPIPPGESVATAELLSTALLQLEDLPSGFERGFLNDASVDSDDPFDFAAHQGWMVRASMWRSKLEGDGFTNYDIKDYRYAFADAENARIYMDAHPHADPARLTAAPVSDFPSETYAFSEIGPVGGGFTNNARIVQLRSVVDRVLISIVAMFPIGDEGWLDSSRELLDIARGRTGDALASAAP